MATRSSLTSRIISELHLEDSSLTAQVALAIDSSVAHYQEHRFWFSEGLREFQASLTALYALSTVMPDGVRIDTVRVRQSNAWYPIIPRTWGELQEMDNTQITGLPSAYAVHHQMLRLYPTPNTTVSIELSWTGNITLSASPTASCAWTNEAEELIRTRSKVDLCENQLKDYAQADRLRGREREIYLRLMSETIQRTCSGKLKGHI